MSDKLIRDELLRSHRYQTLSTDTAKLFFLHLLLASDGHSNVEINTTALSSIMARTISEEVAAKIVSELADHDLVRPYQIDGKSYAHVPRSRQRIKHPSAKHPRPPKNIEDKQISELIAKVGPGADLGRPQGGRSVVEVLLFKDEVGKLSTGANATPTDENGGTSWAEFWKAKGKALGILPNPGEATRDYCRRVIEHVKGN